MNKKNDKENVVNDIKKKPLNIKNKTKISIILACIFLAYCIYLLIKLLNNPIETFIVEQGKIYKEESVTGYILRDEQIVENESSSRKDSPIKGRREKGC